MRLRRFPVVVALIPHVIAIARLSLDMSKIARKPTALLLTCKVSLESLYRYGVRKSKADLITVYFVRRIAFVEKQNTSFVSKLYMKANILAHILVVHDLAIEICEEVGGIHPKTEPATGAFRFEENLKH